MQRIAIFSIVWLAFVEIVTAQTFDISSGGTPTITGASGGSVSGSSSRTTDLNVTINFGEVSPSNTNSIVRVVVPIAIRSLAAYRVTATVTGGTNANVQAIQRSDIGFGANNLRRTGLLSRNCTNSNHIFYSPFTTDPATSITYNGAGRVVYPGDLGDVGTSTTILTGPTLSWLTAGRLSSNAHIFDAIFVITPQFYATGTSTATVTFSIAAGPSVPC